MTDAISVKIDVSSLCDKKTNPDIYKGMIEAAIRQTTLYAEEECKKEAPFKSGALRRGHSSQISPTKGLVKNSQKYWVHVVYGTKAHIITPKKKKALYWKGAKHPVPKVTHPGTAANNYPQRVVNKIQQQKMGERFALQYLRKQGVTE